MATHTDPNQVRLTGENQYMRLHTEANGPMTTRASHWRILLSPEGDWVVYDVLGTGLRVKQAVVPVLTVKRGEVFMRDWGPRPWGWEPDPAPSGEAAFKSCC